MKNKKISETLMFTKENYPISSSLGLLAYGDIAFKFWRKVKKETQENEQ